MNKDQQQEMQRLAEWVVNTVKEKDFGGPCYIRRTPTGVEYDGCLPEHIASILHPILSQCREALVYYCPEIHEKCGCKGCAALTAIDALMVPEPSDSEGIMSPTDDGGGDDH